jgi:hypothetical protein
LIDFQKPTIYPPWLEKVKKRGPPRQRGSPIQEDPPRGRRGSPRGSGSSVQEESDDGVSPTSPQAGNEGDIVVGGGSEEEKVFCKCDWSHIVPCNLPDLKPLKCTIDGCNNFVHYLCQNAFEQIGGFPETMSLKCCLHHPQSPLRASNPPPVNDPEKSCTRLLL